VKKFLLVDTSALWIDRNMVSPGMIVVGENDEGGNIRILHDDTRNRWVIFSDITNHELFHFEKWSDLYTMDMCRSFIRGYRLYLIDDAEDVNTIAIMSVGENLRSEGMFAIGVAAENISILMKENETFYEMIQLAVSMYQAKKHI
jgi:hypothetical protein